MRVHFKHSTDLNKYTSLTDFFLKVIIIASVDVYFDHFKKSKIFKEDQRRTEGSGVHRFQIYNLSKIPLSWLHYIIIDIIVIKFYVCSIT
jgi:hypothetical protein